MCVEGRKMGKYKIINEMEMLGMIFMMEESKSTGLRLEFSRHTRVGGSSPPFQMCLK